MSKPYCLIVEAPVSLSPQGFLWACCIAIGLSLLIAFIEIPTKSKSRLRACLVWPSVFYWLVLSFGNVVTTMLASLAVVKLPATLAPYLPVLTPFFGVFGFETVLKNTNITMFDRGVLTIQSWIDKAATAATAAAIVKEEDISEQEEQGLVDRLKKLNDQEINARVLELEAAARTSGADAKLYKVFQLVSKLNRAERVALLRDKRSFWRTLLIVCVVGLVMVVVLYAVFQLLVIGRRAVVFAGSGNVLPFLKEKFPNLKGTDSWVDVGSSGALEQSFYYSNYGGSIGAKGRTGFIVMSSNGTAALEAKFKAAAPALQEHNYWLSISVARPPLAVLYRGEFGKDLNVHAASAGPPAITYPFVELADLTNFIQNKSPEGMKRYYPEEGAGTRSLLDRAAKNPLQWPNVDEVPGYIEDLNDKGSFVELVSYPQMSRVSKTAASCAQLQQMQIRGALVRTESLESDHLLLADYAVVMKVARDEVAGPDMYLITNSAECQLAQALAPKDIQDCRIFGTPVDHILKLDVTHGGGLESAVYLRCVTP